jgi:tetratricopeptide (TPR) repeat protein
MRRFVSIPALGRAGRLALPLLIALGLAASAGAAPTPPGSSTERPPSSPAEAPSSREQPDDETAAQNRAFAEKEYTKGYKDSEAGKKLAAEGKTAEAAKRFAKALERFEEAVKLDAAYADGWNMVGYCARQVGDLNRAFDAYDRALAIDPDHEEAHEDLGEAYLAIGNVEKAEEQLAWLREKGSEEAEELAEAIAKAASSRGAKAGAGGAAEADSSAAR